jgi:hypothetical protein
MIGADDLETCLACAAEGVEVVPRVNLVANGAVQGVARLHHLHDNVASPEEQPAALERRLVAGMAEDVIPILRT